MMKSSLTFLIISAIIACVLSTSEETCKVHSGSDCDSCLKVKGCGYCKDTKRCFSPSITTTPPCSIANLQVETCSGSLQTWLIILGSVGGVVLIVVIVIIVCICRRCKQRARRKEQTKDDTNNQRSEERRAAAGVRSAERNQAADLMRMKYGLLKAKDDGADYRRMS